MTIKEFLKDIKVTKSRIKVVERQIQELSETASYKSPVIDPNGGGHGTRNYHKDQDLIVKIVDLKNDLERLKMNYIEDVYRATTMILTLPEGKILEVFSMRYLEFQTWEKIADTLGITFQWVHGLHRKGLIELSKRYPFFK